MKGLKHLDLKAKVGIWSWLSYMCRICSTAGVVLLPGTNQGDETCRDGTCPEDVTGMVGVCIEDVTGVVEDVIDLQRT